jgi:DNA modification methylase
MYTSTHRFQQSDARDLSLIEPGSIQLVVTSPPYPMIEMWDEQFSAMDTTIRNKLNEKRGRDAFEAMHRQLYMTWREIFRVMSDGAFACINIGDAVRTVGDRFMLYANHSRIIEDCSAVGFDILPMIHWQKQTNAPNKFMGSGMLPAGAYVTLEHEYILVMRKNGKRVFASDREKQVRRESALFWEERNSWFSDTWTFKGTRQYLSGDMKRTRSAAFPFELAWRLIHMYSVHGDTVLDPFCGTGTTQLAAMTCGRQSVGLDIDGGFSIVMDMDPLLIKQLADDKNRERLENHQRFISEYSKRKIPSHMNERLNQPVVTRQERDLALLEVVSVEKSGGEITVYANANG